MGKRCAMRPGLPTAATIGFFRMKGSRAACHGWKFIDQ
jgi:hypothetical protein